MKTSYWGLAPAIIFIACFFLYALYYSFTQSIGLNPIVGEPSFTLEHYQRLFTERGFLNSVRYTLMIALTAGILSGLLSCVVLFVLFINIEERWIYPVFHTLRAPMLVPYLVAAYMVFILFMDNGGLQSLVANKDISFSFLVNDRQGRGIIITYIWKTLPFFVLTAFPILKRVHGQWHELAHLFHLSKLQFFFKIILPLVAPTFMVSGFIVITYIIAAFEVPFILGSITAKTFPVYIYDLYTQGNIVDRPYLMAMNIVVSVLFMILGILFHFVYKNFDKKVKGWY
ncbi:MAG: ABC transporter permease [Brevinema sp.]